MTLLDAAIILLAGLAAGTINGIIGSGTLITFPVLVALGYPPVVANQTSSLGLFPGAFASVLAFTDDLRGHGRATARFALCSLVGSAIGATLLLALPASAFEAVVPVLIAGALVLIVLQPRIATALAERRKPGAAEIGRLVFLAIAVTGIYGGYFGAAQGIMLFAVLGTALPDDPQRVNGTRPLLAGMANLVSAVIFVAVGDPDYAVAGLLAVSAIAGGLLGGLVAKRLSKETLRVVIVLVGIAAIVQLLV